MKVIRRFIQDCEESSISFGLWIGSVLAVIFVRDCVESLAIIHSFPLLDYFHLFHIPIFFLAMLLSLIVLLHIFTKEDIVKISKFSLVFFPIIIFPAFFDFLAAVMFNANISYEYISEHNNLRQIFVNFFNPFFKVTGVTYSLRIEILIICLIFYLYVYVKTNSKIKPILGLLAAYCIFTFYGALPSLLIKVFVRVASLLAHLFPLALSGKMISGVMNENIVMIVVLASAALAAAFWFWFYSPKKFKAALKGLKVTYFFYYLILFGLGIGLYLYPEAKIDGFIIISALGVFLAFLFALKLSSIMDDLFDLERDKILNPRRPLVTGLISRNEYTHIAIVYLAFSLLFAIWVSVACFMIDLLFIVIRYLYSAPPFRLKRFFITSSLINGFLSLLILLIGQVSLAKSDATILLYPPLLWTVFVTAALSSNVKDLKNVSGDRCCNIYSIPVIFGESIARKIIAFLVLLSYLSVPLLLNRFFYDFRAAIISLVFGLVSYFFIKREESREGPVFLLFFIYISIVLLFLL